MITINCSKKNTCHYYATYNEFNEVKECKITFMYHNRMYKIM